MCLCLCRSRLQSRRYSRTSSKGSEGAVAEAEGLAASEVGA